MDSYLSAGLAGIVAGAIGTWLVPVVVSYLTHHRLIVERDPSDIVGVAALTLIAFGVLGFTLSRLQSAQNWSDLFYLVLYVLGFALGGIVYSAVLTWRSRRELKKPGV